MNLELEQFTWALLTEFDNLTNNVHIPVNVLTCSCDQSICFSIKRPFSLTKIYLRKIFKIKI